MKFIFSLDLIRFPLARRIHSLFIATFCFSPYFHAWFFCACVPGFNDRRTNKTRIGLGGIKQVCKAARVTIQRSSVNLPLPDAPLRYGGNLIAPCLFLLSTAGRRNRLFHAVFRMSSRSIKPRAKLQSVCKIPNPPAFADPVISSFGLVESNCCGYWTGGARNGKVSMTCQLLSKLLFFPRALSAAQFEPFVSSFWSFYCGTAPLSPLFSRRWTESAGIPASTSAIGFNLNN